MARNKVWGYNLEDNFRGNADMRLFDQAFLGWMMDSDFANGLVGGGYEFFMAMIGGGEPYNRSYGV